KKLGFSKLSLFLDSFLYRSPSDRALGAFIFHMVKVEKVGAKSRYCDVNLRLLDAKKTPLSEVILLLASFYSPSLALSLSPSLVSSSENLPCPLLIFSLSRFLILALPLALLP